MMSMLPKAARVASTTAAGVVGRVRSPVMWRTLSERPVGTAERGFGFEQDGFVDVVEHDAGAGLEQAFGDGSADAAAGAGDECGAAFEGKGHLVSLLSHGTDYRLDADGGKLWMRFGGEGL